MNKKVYIVTDTYNGERVSVHATRIGARETALEYLKDKTGYTHAEWLDFANTYGFGTVDEFQNAILTCGDYDEGLHMEVEEVEVLD